jgi:hypothetical protein
VLDAVPQGVWKAIGQAAARVARDARTAREVEVRRLGTRPTVPAEMVQRLLGEANDADIARVARFVASPDFEFLALQVVIASYAPGGGRAEILAEVREELFQGLRQAVDLEPHQLTGLADALHDALIIGHRELAPESRAGEVPDNAVLSAVGHLAAMAARNGQLLSRLSALADLHELAVALRRQVAEIHGVLRLPHTGASRSVPWAQLYVEPAFDPKVALDRLVIAPRRTVVLGDPGAGKSTLLRKLAYDTTAGGTVPFLVVLRDLAELGGDRLVEHLARSCRDPYNLEMPVEAVEYYLLNGHAVVLLDGLDELTNMALRQRVVMLIEGFVALYPLVPVIVTSRRVGYRSAPLSTRYFQEYEISRFDEPRVGRYVENWFRLDDSAQPDERRRLGESFMRESQSIDDLRSNPLLLALLCAMYSAEHYIPRQRAQIYERCATLLFETWDSMRDIPMPMQFQGQVRGAIQTLAWRMLSGEAAAELPRDAVTRILANYLVQKKFSRDTAWEQARRFLEFCAGRAWVLSELGANMFEPVYGFAHRTFMEYFAAEHIVRRCQNADQVWQLLGPAVLAGQWEIVSQLVLQLFERNHEDGADTLLNRALDGWAEADRQQRCALAAFVANALAHVSPSPPTVARIADAVVACALQLSDGDRSPVVSTPEAARAMQLADGPLMTALTRALPSAAEDVDAEIRASLGRAVVRGDDVAHLLVASWGFARGSEAMAAVRHEHAQRFSAWHDRHRFGLVERVRRDPRLVLDTVARFGARPFYEYLHASGMVRDPFVHSLADERWTTRLACALIAEPRPWVEIPSRNVVRWDPRTGPGIIIGLPHLESNAERPTMSKRIAALWESHHGFKRRGAWRNRRLIAEMDVDEPYAGFLLRWANGEFSVATSGRLSLSDAEVEILRAADRGQLIRMAGGQVLIVDLALPARYLERVVALEKSRRLLEEGGEEHPAGGGRRLKLTAPGRAMLLKSAG